MFNVLLTNEQFNELKQLARQRHLLMATMTRTWLLDRLEQERRPAVPELHSAVVHIRADSGPAAPRCGQAQIRSPIVRQWRGTRPHAWNASGVGLSRAADDELTGYARDHDAVPPSHDIEFTQRGEHHEVSSKRVNVLLIR